MKKDARVGLKTGLRAVLDTNVYLSAFYYPNGIPAKIFEAGILKMYQRVVSPAIIEEYARISRKKFGAVEEEIEQDKKMMAHGAAMVKPSFLPRAVPDDEDDNRIIACAIAGKADVVVSGDKDLLRLGEYEGIAIVRPVDFLRILGER